MTPFRERDVRVLIRDLLEQTGAFDEVRLGMPEARGSSAGRLRTAVVEPVQTVRNDPWDDLAADPLMTCHVRVILMSRDDDPQVRDDVAERLLNITANALLSDALAAWVIPSRTRFRSWTWEDAVAPERRISAILEYQYLVDGVSGLNTSE